MPDRDLTPLQRALAAACEYAQACGVTAEITPESFAIQPSPAGMTVATVVTVEHVVIVTVNRTGTTLGVAELMLTHDTELWNGRPVTDIYLPGDSHGDDWLAAVEAVGSGRG
ncbi:hypothetical protein ACFXG4_08505 [Nocardia sp. NPDC059246]|uniref:hypothetical protein n=1 Tax=unclassified Nocardia TaxID=2637762 RepID=UPI0036813ED2